jgi:hypothetical protein
VFLCVRVLGGTDCSSLLQKLIEPAAGLCHGTATCPVFLALQKYSVTHFSVHYCDPELLQKNRIPTKKMFIRNSKANVQRRLKCFRKAT